MRKTLSMSAVAAMVAATIGFAVTSTQAGAGVETSDIYVVHGLNFDGQTDTTTGGTNVTVCVNGDEAIADFEFGQVVGPLQPPTGATLEVAVFGGAGVDCTAGGPVVIPLQEIVVPAGTAAVVATEGPGVEDRPELVPFALDVDCVDPGNGRLTGAHAASAGEVDVMVAGSSAGTVAFGAEPLVADLPAADYEVQIDLVPGGPTIFGPSDVPVTEAVNTIVYVTGNYGPEGEATPVVPIVQTIDLETCESPTTTTTTTTAPPAEPAAPAPAATATAAQPSFTG